MEVKNKVVVDCGTKGYMDFAIEDIVDLNMVVDRYHITENGLELITRDSDHLIGTTLKLRTVLKCSLVDVKNILCKTCYGEMSNWKK